MEGTEQHDQEVYLTNTAHSVLIPHWTRKDLATHTPNMMHPHSILSFLYVYVDVVCAHECKRIFKQT